LNFKKRGKHLILFFTADREISAWTYARKLMRKILMIAAIIFCSSAFAQSDKDIMEEVAVTCASTLATAGLITDVKISKMIFERDAKWWFSALSKFVGNKQQAIDRLSPSMYELKEKFNRKEISWNELLEIGERCSSMKLAAETKSN
jgi:uncharacterized membrane protein YfbV (UPF0208 family)